MIGCRFLGHRWKYADRVRGDRTEYDRFVCTRCPAVRHEPVRPSSFRDRMEAK